MNLEIILWFVAGIVLSEIIFIIWYTYEYNDHYGNMNWKGVKFLSFLAGGGFISIQYLLVMGIESDPGYGYIVLLYEVIGIVIISIFMWINSLIAKKIEKKKRDKERRELKKMKRQTKILKKLKKKFNEEKKKERAMCKRVIRK